MPKSLTIIMIIILSGLLFIPIGCGGGGSGGGGTGGSSTTSSPSPSPSPTQSPSPSPSPSPEYPTNIDSPGGTITPGTKCYFLDASYYVVETQPYNEGNFTVYRVGTASKADEEIQKFDVLPVGWGSNDCKGIATNVFMSDIMEFAVMYHGAASTAFVHRVGEEGMVGKIIALGVNYHFMKYNSANFIEFKVDANDEPTVLPIGPPD